MTRRIVTFVLVTLGTPGCSFVMTSPTPAQGRGGTQSCSATGPVMDAMIVAGLVTLAAYAFTRQPSCDENGGACDPREGMIGGGALLLATPYVLSGLAGVAWYDRCTDALTQPARSPGPGVAWMP
jgi:hypothetical protein